MTTEQQKAYDIGYKTYTTGVALTGKVKVDRTAFTTNNYQSFGGDFSLASSLYDYYVNGYNQAKADAAAKTTASTPLPDQSTLTNLIKSQYARLKRSYTSADITNWLSQCANLWKQIDEPKNLDKLADKLVRMFNSLPPQETAVVDNQQDYAPVIESPSTPVTQQTNPLIENVIGAIAAIPGAVTTTPATTTTTQATQTVTSISDVTDNAMDYSPAIASSTDTAVSTDTTAAAVTQAGMSSNTLAIILLVGAALGIIAALFKGAKK